MSRLAGKYFWAAAGKFGSIFLAFLFNLILARWFLSPREFGLIGVLQIFIALGSTTVVGGFGQALVQKKRLRKVDVNTVYAFNVGTSLFFYLLLYIFAPTIAKFYGMTELVRVLRWLALVLVLDAFCLVPYSLMVRYQDFGKLCFVTLVSTVGGYSLGFLLAWRGYGVWSLVFATLSISFFQLLLFLAVSKVYPRFSVSGASFRELIPFSGYIYLATMMERLYLNALSAILGKRFDAIMVGYYTQANKLQSVPAGGVQEISHQVLLPEFSRHQADGTVLREKYMRNLHFLTLVAAWIFSVLYVVAEPAVVLLYTDKWLPSAVMLRVLCPAGLFFVLCYIPTLLIRAVGRARSYFVLLLSEYLVAIATLMCLSSLGLESMLYGLVGANALFFLINAVYVSGLDFGISIWSQLRKVLPTVALFGAVAYLTLRTIGWLGIGSIGWHLVVGVVVPSIPLLLLSPEARRFILYTFKH
ncbi:MAG: lipopolysaccharide biosynthesis protein [Bacteroidia bacterium]|jgi:polysaccharide biosynthesis protein|nr:lipopolysaccharide biosynthesis protein [Bacteroidia bacterium]